MDFESLYRQHVQAVFRFAMSITRRRDIAEDLTSEAFLALHREIDSIDPAQLPAWLLTVVRNRARPSPASDRGAIRHRQETCRDAGRAPAVIVGRVDSGGRRTETDSPVVRDAALRLRHDAGRDCR